MSRKKSAPYAEEFKRSSAQLAFESEQSIKNTAKDLGINPSTLYTWVEKCYPGAHTTTSHTSVHEELKAVKKELSRVKQERDILKKASAYFARQM
ncbi:MAG: transposase [Legionella sp.]|nr:transposase [Legionella sp.]